MYLEVEGILINRKSVREYDEKITFFTEALGKIFCYAYGTRSAKSNRRHLLGSFDWLNLELEKKKENYVLKGLEKITNNHFEKNPEHFMTFAHFLRKVDKLLPPQTAEQSIYQLLKRMTLSPFKDASIAFQEFYFSYFLLYLLGVFPYVYLQEDDAILPNNTTPLEGLFLYDYQVKIYLLQLNKDSVSQYGFPILSNKALAVVMFFGASLEESTNFFNNLYEYSRSALQSLDELVSLVEFANKLLDLH